MIFTLILFYILINSMSIIKHGYVIDMTINGSSQSCLSKIKTAFYIGMEKQWQHKPTSSLTSRILQFSQIVYKWIDTCLMNYGDTDSLLRCRNKKWFYSTYSWDDFVLENEIIKFLS